MPSLSITDLFKMAYVRNDEAISYFKSQAKKCKNPETKTFLHFLTGKKREQQLLLEKIVSKYNHKISALIHTIPDQKRLLINQSNYLYLKKLKDIYKFAYEYAVNELDFYIHISSLVRNNLAQSALDTLMDLSKDFVFDVRLAYIDFIAKQYTQPFEPTGKNHHSAIYEVLPIIEEYN
jgi:hypothetical protein